FLAYFSIIVFALVLVLILIAELAEERVAKIALNKLNQQVDANISVKSIDFSLLKDFPDAMVELQDVGITASNDSLAGIHRLFISVELMPLMSSEFVIKKISIEGGMANYQIDSTGRTNFDVFLSDSSDETTDTTSSGTLYLSLEHLELNNLFCSFNDDVNHVSACLYIDEGLTSIYIDDENTKASFKGQLRANQCRYPESPLHLMNELKLNMDVTYFNDLISIKDLQLNSDGIALQASGELKNDSSVYADLKVKAEKLDLGILNKYVPDSLMRAYELSQLQGILKAESSISGMYNDSTMPKLDARLNFKNGAVKMGDYPLVGNINLVGSYTNGSLMNNETSKVEIDTFAFVSGESKGLFSGIINNLEKIDYSLKSDLLLNMADLKPFIPDSLVKSIAGEVQLNFQTQGTLPEKYDLAFADYMLDRSIVQLQMKDFEIDMDSLIQVSGMDAVMDYQKQNFQLSKLSGTINTYALNIDDAAIKGRFNGSLKDVDAMDVILEDIELSMPGSHLLGHLNIDSIGAPRYQMEADVIANLADFIGFAPESLIKDMSGVVYAQLKSEGTLNMDDLVESTMEKLFTSSQLETQMQDVTVLMQDPSMQLKGVSGQISLQNDSIAIKKLHGAFSGITFESDSTWVQNFYNAYWLNRADTIKAEGYFNAGDIDYALIESFMTKDTTAKKEPVVQASEPVNYSFQAKGQLKVNRFKYGKALIENMSALYKVCDTLYLIEELKLHAFKGEMNSSLRFEAYNEDEMRMFFKNKTNKMDIYQILTEFDDFKEYGNTFIDHEQLTGLLSTDLLGEVVIRDSVITDEIRVQGGMLLEDGRLQNYDIAVEMGQEYGIDGMEDIVFKTIDTKLFVFDNSIYAPQTDIKTNKFNVTLFGMQNFNLDCEYHLRFYLKEILRKGQTKRLEKKQTKNEGNTKDGGGVKGLTSMFAYYIINNGITKSGLESEKSDERRAMKRKLRVKQSQVDLIFDQGLVEYETGVNR
ncbi:MAG: AsmA family protein, partial [Carboxylicivirga sp.]|nr:AsmA family protein [Carboxylicivirga sp.]